MIIHNVKPLSERIKMGEKFSPKLLSYLSKIQPPRVVSKKLAKFIKEGNK